MEYNKVKRGLEKGAAIYSTVINAIEIVTFFAFIIYGIELMSLGYYEAIYFGTIYLSLGISMFLLSIPKLILSIFLIKTPVQEDGTIKNTNGIRIALLVLSFLSENWITTGLMIAVLCLKDVITPKATQNVQYVKVAQPQPQPQQNSIEGKIAQLKQLKELGVITDDVYKKAIEKIISEM